MKDWSKVLIFSLLGLGILWLVTRKPSIQQPAYYQPLELSPASPMRLAPPQTSSIHWAPAPKLSSNQRQYVNEETWDISYNDDGLPTQLKISRHAQEG